MPAVVVDGKRLRQWDVGRSTGGQRMSCQCSGLQKWTLIDGGWTSLTSRSIYQYIPGSWKESGGCQSKTANASLGFCFAGAPSEDHSAVEEAPLSEKSNDHHVHDHTEPPSDLELRVKALESLLIEKGLVDPAALDLLIDTYETKIGPRNGARVVARAWSDPAFKKWLLADATLAIASLGYAGRQGEHMKLVENTANVHNLVVCTLCSCYPWPVLGLPPVWYKSAPYRARAVADPRGVLKEFGTELGDEVELRVWDSTSEVRFLVLPERPAGTDGWSEEQLAGLVTRNSMIGVEKARTPSR